MLGCPRQNFTDLQFSALRKHVEEGGALLVLMEEGGEKKANTNINFLLEEFGISVNNGKHLSKSELIWLDAIRLLDAT